jgi:hypothetical protein
MIYADEDDTVIDRDAYRRNYDALTKEWRTEILKRREQAEGAEDAEQELPD